MTTPPTNPEATGMTLTAADLAKIDACHSRMGYTDSSVIGHMLAHIAAQARQLEALREAQSLTQFRGGTKYKVKA